INPVPILPITLSPHKQSLQHLTHKLQNHLLPSIQPLHPLSSLQPSPHQIKQLQFSFKQNKFKQYPLHQQTLQNIIKPSHLNLPLTLYTFPNKQKSVL
ncbi:hypothetical protein, partial [Bacillus pumilus]|uniref:hypothetical protein n=1 Tax=Bacillus pumilus TaxID=1408 RepID=UPI001C930992